MPMTMEEIFLEAKMLPNESKVLLAEKLVIAIENDSGTEVTRSHMQEVIRRRDEIRSGKVQLIDGQKGLVQIRATI